MPLSITGFFPPAYPGSPPAFDPFFIFSNFFEKTVDKCVLHEYNRFCCSDD
ncbi:hypothetical protein BACCAP_00584 [Pseudoflavonifractor capillosus ATCC 29799]|uniref:Uncharacterized protein n=1 Tax=Pseudoflavonifractor capillosus ATCC 29799 TaxID=411467 RepID=A6NQW1_9FIRM|nr:hypothetical protein BACCAP_00584 [Pseudoflavonifractor capillosus ATCC 29799]